MAMECFITYNLNSVFELNKTTQKKTQCLTQSLFKTQKKSKPHVILALTKETDKMHEWNKNREKQKLTFNMKPLDETQNQRRSVDFWLEYERVLKLFEFVCWEYLVLLFF